VLPFPRIRGEGPKIEAMVGQSAAATSRA
jgi:hypothetical protein